METGSLETVKAVSDHCSCLIAPGLKSGVTFFLSHNSLRLKKYFRVLSCISWAFLFELRHGVARGKHVIMEIGSLETVKAVSDHCPCLIVPGLKSGVTFFLVQNSSRPFVCFAGLLLRIATRSQFKYFKTTLLTTIPQLYRPLYKRLYTHFGKSQEPRQKKYY